MQRQGQSAVDAASVNIGSDYTPDEVEFMFAVEAEQRRLNRKFLAWSEILAILKSLGYSKT
jgi:hypothetical protein